MDGKTTAFAPMDKLISDPEQWSHSVEPPGLMEELARSLGLCGQTEALFAIEGPDGVFTVIDGARRLEILRASGARGAWIAVLPAGSAWDGLLTARESANRPLNPAEAGVYLKKRMAATGETPGELCREVFPRLGLAPRPGGGADVLWIASLPDWGKLLFATGEAPLAGIRALSNAPLPDVLAVLAVTKGLKLGANKFVETCRWMLECAWGEGKTASEWLAGADLPSREEGGHALREAVKRRRYPRLMALSDSFAADAARLKLPPRAAFSHATDFEGGRLRLTVDFASMEELSRAAGEISASAARGDFKALEKYLD